MKKIILVTLFFAFAIFTFAQSFDLRDNWAGSYRGTASTNTINSKILQSTDGLILKINKKSNVTQLGNFGYGAENYSIYIELPDEYEQIQNLTILKNELIFKPSRKYPFEWHLYKEKDKYGDVVIKGTFKYYEVLSNGELSMTGDFYNIYAY